jgi:tetratricopeptide (TPR) repeat protein
VNDPAVPNVPAGDTPQVAQPSSEGGSRSSARSTWAARIPVLALIGGVTAALVISIFAFTVSSRRTAVVIRRTAGAPAPPADLYRQIGALQSRVDSQGTEQTILLTFVALLLTMSAAGFVLTDRRAREVHSLAVRGESTAQARIAEAHQLAMRGESASQSRAEEVHTSFLQGSVQTLSLVNETLELERIASQRAASAVEQKAREQLTTLDRSAKNLLSRVPTDDDHALVTDLAIRADLSSLARKIASFANALLPVDVPLTPHCQFIRGMQLHLDQHYDDAFDEWDAVTFAPETDLDLRSLTWYWIGRERGNLGQFTEAGRAFEQSLKDAPEARRYELQRLMLEMEFFNAGSYEPPQLIEQMQRLITVTGAAETDAAERALPHMRAVLGNMHHEVALEYREAGQLADARHHFEQCKALFVEIRHEKWALFGLAEALWWLDEREEAEELFANEARSFAQDEYIHRIEFRTKVLARSAELICCARASALRGEADHVFHDVLDALGRVDARMTIYSEVQRRNVDKTTFLADMQKVLGQAKDVPDPIGPADC